MLRIPRLEDLHLRRGFLGALCAVLRICWEAFLDIVNKDLKYDCMSREDCKMGRLDFLPYRLC